MPTTEELGAAVLIGSVLVTIPAAATLTYLDEKRREKNDEKKRKEAGKDGASDSECSCL